MNAWRLSGRVALSLDRPLVMAILNLTPDSFSDGGRYSSVGAVVTCAARAVAEGADVLDLGGESTRPGAARVPAAEQLRRLLPVVEAIRAQPGPLGTIPISIDTTLEAVARTTLDAGADAINDVSAGTEDPEMFALAAKRGAGIVLMHRLSPPPADSYSDSYPIDPTYGDVVVVVRDFLAARVTEALRAGIAQEAIVIDPGLGFGKSVKHNLELVRRTAEIAALGYPVLSGASRKSFVGRISLDRDSTPDERLAGSLAFSVAHYLYGAAIFRVHDPGPHAEALLVASVLGRGPSVPGDGGKFPP